MSKIESLEELVGMVRGIVSNSLCIPPVCINLYDYEISDTETSLEDWGNSRLHIRVNFPRSQVLLNHEKKLSDIRFAMRNFQFIVNIELKISIVLEESKALSWLFLIRGNC